MPKNTANRQNLHIGDRVSFTRTQGFWEGQTFSGHITALCPQKAGIRVDGLGQIFDVTYPNIKPLLK